MRGYGQSDRPVQHYDMEVWADDLAGLMDALGSTGRTSTARRWAG